MKRGAAQSYYGVGLITGNGNIGAPPQLSPGKRLRVLIHNT